MLHGDQGRRLWRPLPGRVPHCPTPRLQPSRELLGLQPAQSQPAEPPARTPPQRITQLADHGDRPGERRHGPAQQRPDRLHQDEAPEDAERAGRIGLEPDPRHRRRHVQAGRRARVLQGHHPAHHAGRPGPGGHIYGVRVFESVVGGSARRDCERAV